MFKSIVSLCALLSVATAGLASESSLPQLPIEVIGKGVATGAGTAALLVKIRSVCPTKLDSELCEKTIEVTSINLSAGRQLEGIAIIRPGYSDFFHWVMIECDQMGSCQFAEPNVVRLTRKGDEIEIFGVTSRQGRAGQSSGLRLQVEALGYQSYELPEGLSGLALTSDYKEK